MRALAKVGAIGALLVTMGLGLAACQTQGSATKIATTRGDVGPATWLAKPEGRRPLPRRRAGCTAADGV